MPSRYSIAGGSHGAGHRVDVVDGYGVRHVMLGFDTEADALQWIEADKVRERLHQLEPLADAAD